MTTLIDDHDRRVASAGEATVRRHTVTIRSVVRAEWTKLTSVRSYLVTLGMAGILLVAFGTMFASLAGSDQSFGPDQPVGSDSLSTSLGAIDVSQLMLGVLGAVFIVGEYSSGLIRTMFTAVADRTRVLIAKAVVLGLSTWVVMTLAAFVVLATGRAAYGGDGTLTSLSDDGVIRALLGVGVYGVGVVLMGMAVGFIVRSTAATISILVAVLMMVPGMIGLLPAGFSDPVSKILPSNAGQAFLAVTPRDDLLSPAVGAAVFAAWVLALLAVAAVGLRRRDA